MPIFLLKKVGIFGSAKVNFSNMPIFLVEKMCTAKVSLIFSTKNISVFGYKVIKHLTS